ncbi:MAG: TonB-dependent receptor [Pseudomonadales bacterium]|nr:TonB-dependent receptor [Pseudomonadales bacterium]
MRFKKGQLTTSQFTVIAIAMALPFIANAEPQLKRTPYGLETIIVTATRGKQQTMDVPASIGVKTSDQISLDLPAYQKDLLNSISGVRITQTGSTLGHMTAIRLPVNTGPYYLFLQDGIPVQSSGFFNHNGLAYTNFSAAGSVEVLKGAGTALYGSDSVAATINVISRDPSLRQGHTVIANTGSDGFYKLGLSSGFNTSSNSGTHSNLGFEVSHTKSDGWRDHTATKRSELNVTHFYNIDANNSFKTIFSANTSEAEISGSIVGLAALHADPASVGDIQSALDSGLEIQRNFDFARLSTDWSHALNNQTQLSTIVYLRSNRNRYTATWEKNLPHNDSQQQTVGVLFKVNIDKGDTRWIAGTDIEVTKSNLKYTQLFNFVPSGFGSPVPTGSIYDYDVGYLAVAPYIRAEHDISHNLQVTAGLRYDNNAYDYTNNLADGQHAASTYSRPSSDNDPTYNHLSPKLSLAYRIDKHQNAYIRYANGFRIPQASRLYSLRTNNISFTLEPEVTDTIEFGYKRATTAFEFDAALYHMLIDDSIVRRENSGGDRFYVNGGKTIHQGLELSLLSIISKQFSGRIAASYSQHQYVNDAVFGNNEQAAAPNTTANLRLIYKPKPLTGLVAMLEGEYVSKYWLDDANTKTYEGYTIYHLKTSYKASKRLNFTAKIVNLMDEIYAENASFSYGNEKYTPGAPRQFFAGMQYSFD